MHWPVRRDGATSRLQRGFAITRGLPRVRRTAILLYDLPTGSLKY